MGLICSHNLPELIKLANGYRSPELAKAVQDFYAANEQYITADQKELYAQANKTAVGSSERLM